MIIAAASHSKIQPFTDGFHPLPVYGAVFRVINFDCIQSLGRKSPYMGFVEAVESCMGEAGVSPFLPKPPDLLAGVRRVELNMGRTAIPEKPPECLLGGGDKSLLHQGSCNVWPVNGRSSSNFSYISRQYIHTQFPEPLAGFNQPVFTDAPQFFKPGGCSLHESKILKIGENVAGTSAKGRRDFNRWEEADTQIAGGFAGLYNAVKSIMIAQGKQAHSCPICSPNQGCRGKRTV